MSDGAGKRLEGQGREHLFKPGKSGNPGGRPKTKTLSKAYKNLLEQVNPADKEGRTYAECLAESMVRMGLKGNVQACVEICDRVEGKVRQAVTEVDDEFADKSIEELEAELERTGAGHSGEPDTKTPPDGGYTQ